MTVFETRLRRDDQSALRRSVCCVIARREIPALLGRLRPEAGFGPTTVWIPDDDGLNAMTLLAAHPELTVCASFEMFARACARADVVVVSREPGLIDRRIALAIVGAAIRAATQAGRPMRVWSASIFRDRADQGGVPAQDPETEDWLVSIIDREAPGRRLKRTLDCVLAGLALVFVAPLLALVTLLVRLESPGPALFIQERVGHRGQPFRVIKFRTMCRDAEALDRGVPTMTKLNDNRITRLGRFLRKSRLDELPQLINVLKGEMALVGPRPFRRFLADETARFVPFYRVRYTEKPGLTGWAQVAYKYPTSFEEQVEKFEFEFGYIARRSTRFDLYIMLRTLWVMLCLKGA